MKKLFLLSIIIFLFALGNISIGADKIDINTASLEQLDTLTGIGPIYAQRIIDNRPYSSIDELDKVKGIGPATLQKIKDQGLACVNCAMASTLTLTPTTAPTTTPTYLSGVTINEIMPNPQGADETEEWIELYNSNNTDVDLSSWRLQDTNGTVITYTIPNNTKILAGLFLVFKRPETKIMLNNDEDGLNLLMPDGKIVNSITFTSAPLGQSYNKISSNWAWSTAPTPGSKNIIPIAKALPKPENSVKNDGIELGLADLSQAGNLNQDNNTINPWFLFFTVLTATIILAIIVLLIKFKLNHVRT